MTERALLIQVTELKSNPNQTEQICVAINLHTKEIHICSVKITKSPFKMEFNCWDTYKVRPQ
jgi:hypothetical protein